MELGKGCSPARRLLRLALALTTLLALTLTLVACQGSPSVLAPASPDARRILDLSRTVFVIALIVFVVVEGLLFFIIFRFRSRGEEGEPSQVHGHTRLEIMWTALPGLVLVVVLVLMVQTMAAALQPMTDPLEINVVGHRWWWEVRYPGYPPEEVRSEQATTANQPAYGVVTANEIHIPVQKDVHVPVNSVDVIHSFWVPELGGKVDMIPGNTNYVRLHAEQPGVYRGQCAEFCGVDHALMAFIVVAESQEEFDAWIRNQQLPAQAPESPLEEAGMRAFMSQPCVGCHSIRGTNARGQIGPDLTHIGSRRTIAAGSLENTPENMRRWIADPQEVKPGNLMQYPPLPPETVDAITAYMMGLE